MQLIKAGYPTIEPTTTMPYYPLSFQQERIYYLNKLSVDGPLWNRISCKRLRGNIDVGRMQAAIDALVERHAALRIRISLVDGTPLQSRHAALDGVFACVDLSGEPPDSSAEHAHAILQREYEQPLSLEGGQLFKAVLIRCGDAECWLILKLHHIISDETTLRILWHDLKVLYNAQFGGDDGLRTLEIAYVDYATWLCEQLAEDNTQEQEAYWLGQFAGKLPELDLPTDFPTPPNLTFNGALEKQRLPRQLIKRLQTFSLERRVIPFSAMLSAYYLLLHQYCRQDDIVIGTVFSGRHYSPKIKPLVGFFSNTVALRAHIDTAQTVEAFIKQIHAQVDDAHDMQDYPFERLVGKLDLDRAHKRNPLFRAMFNMVTGYEETQTFEGIAREEWTEPDISMTQVDFFLDFHLKPDESEARIEYNADIFSKATIQRMLKHYITIVKKMLDAPDTIVGELSMLDAAEEQLVLSFGKGQRGAAFTRGIVEVLEERAAYTPEDPAILFGDKVISCFQLNRRVNQLAATLVEAGAAEGDVVAIMLDRSPELVIGLLAILKAGAAYLPIDPAFPQQRIEYILQDSGAACMLVHGEAGHKLPPTVKTIPVAGKNAPAGAGTNIGRKTDPTRPAYVIYTSGSTGKPKGVVVEHRALMNTLEFLEATYPLPGKTFLFKTNFTFDVSATELFGWLFEDGRLAVLDKGAEKDPAKLLEAIDKYDVTHINFVPSMLDAFLSALQPRDIPTFEKLRYVFAAGEALKPDLSNRFYSTIRDVRLENLYGPTETAIYATCYSLPRGQDCKRVPIGKPVANTRAYILDESLRLLPVGMTGELCLSGAGLARGYLNQPDLTAERFIPNPFAEVSGIGYRVSEDAAPNTWHPTPDTRLYKTGDLAKMGDDGLIYFLGRADAQVKIRGFRVELGEVEQLLLACRGVTESAVKARTDQFGQKTIVAYLALEKSRNGSLEHIREELVAWLPDYMIPELFVEVERLPRLPSGKTDMQALPEPERKLAPAPQAPVSELEQTIIMIAEELLNTSGLDPNSNFFRLGGNSLLTLRFVTALDSALGTRLSVMDFLRLPTIAEIARLIEVRYHVHGRQRVA